MALRRVFVRVPLSQALKTYCGVPERAFTHHTVPKQDYKPWAVNKNERRRSLATFHSSRITRPSHQQWQSFVSSSGLGKIDQELQVWHKDCTSCEAIKYLLKPVAYYRIKQLMSSNLSGRGISPEIRGVLQHYFTCRTTYWMLTHVARAMARLLVARRILREMPSDSLPVKTRKLCQLLMNHWDHLFKEPDVKLEDYTEDLEVLSRLSGQLSQVDENAMSGSFNCDDYEVFMRSLRNVARILKQDDVVDAINHFLRHDEGKLPEDLDESQLLWERTFIDLIHAEGDQYFGSELMGSIQEPFLKYAEYEFKCHGQPVTSDDVIHL